MSVLILAYGVLCALCALLLSAAIAYTVRR
jgi:hypothetical protein